MCCESSGSLQPVSLKPLTAIRPLPRFPWSASAVAHARIICSQTPASLLYRFSISSYPCSVPLVRLPLVGTDFHPRHRFHSRFYTRKVRRGTLGTHTLDWEGPLRGTLGTHTLDWEGPLRGTLGAHTLDWEGPPARLGAFTCLFGCCFGCLFCFRAQVCVPPSICLFVCFLVVGVGLLLSSCVWLLGLFPRLRVAFRSFACLLVRLFACSFVCL